MKIKELQTLSDEDLVAKEKQFKHDLFLMNNQRQVGRLEKPAAVGKLKKDIARILTLLNERKHNGKKN